MPYLAQYQYGLPMDSITLGNLLQIAGIGIGAALLGVGGITVAGTIISRKRKLNYKPYELGKK